MSESKPADDVRDTYDFAEKLKSAEEARPQDPGGAPAYAHVLRSAAWAVRVVMFYGDADTSKRDRDSHILSVTTTVYVGKTFVLYRRQMLRLIGWPKPCFDQLAICLPCLMGFRAKEVCTWRAEYVDYVADDALVLDAKKHRLFTVPMPAAVERLAERHLDLRSEGYVLQSRSTAWRHPERPISTTALWYIWRKWTREAQLPNADEISPVVGRRFFAAEWVYGQGLSVVTLSRILRHTDPVVTMRYVQGLVFYEDVKRDADRFQLGLIEAVPT